MNRALFLAFAITLTISNASKADLSVRKCVREKTECDFYCDSAEAIGCDESNYLVAFGGYYCRKFLNDAASYSSHGQFVLQNIRSCLIRELATRRLSCDTVEDIAFDNHVDCYVDNGFCALGANDRARIVWSVRSELLKKKFRMTAARITQACKQ